MHWQLEIWETTFFCEFKQKGEIMKNKPFEQQYGGEEVAKHSVYKYEFIE
jgi:hypothetical protein